MAKSGKIERLEHGVYRMSGTPHDSSQGIYAVWLGTSPRQMAHERRIGHDGIVVGGRSAAAIHGMGDFFLSPYHIYTPTRINSKRPGIIFIKRAVDPSDVTYTGAGLPVTSATRTVFDLMCDGEDPSHVTSALKDAVRDGAIDEGRLMALAKARQGFPYSQSEIEDLMRSTRGE